MSEVSESLRHEWRMRTFRSDECIHCGAIAVQGFGLKIDREVCEVRKAKSLADRSAQKWIKPTEADLGYHWIRSDDGRSHPEIIRLVEWRAGLIDGIDKPRAHEYLAEFFGSDRHSHGARELERQGYELLPIEFPNVPLPPS